MNTIRSVESALQLAVVHTFENMAFTEANPLDPAELEESPQNNLCVNLPLTKPYSGEICIALPRECASMITQALYGLAQEELTEEIISDTLAELLNTLAGRFMQELLSSAQKFELGFPQLNREGDSHLNPPAALIYFNVEGHRLKVAVYGTDLMALTETQMSSTEVES